MASADDRAAELAARQHGVFSRSQLMAAGASSPTIARRVSGGRWTPVARGIYRLAGFALATEGTITAALLAEPRLVVSHATAARLWRFPLMNRAVGQVELTSTSDRAPTGPWLIHRAASLDDRHVRVVDGWRCTSRERTLIDLGGWVHPATLERILDAELSAGRVQLSTLATVFERVGQGRPGAKAMRTLIDARFAAATESDLERRLLSLVASAGLPTPVTQWPAPWLGGNRRVDAAYPDQRLIIELDGQRWHSDPASFENDRRRDQLATAAGWRTVRLTWDQVTCRPNEVVDLLRHLLSNPAA